MLRKALYLKWTGAVGTGVAGIASALPVAARTMARAIGGARRGGRAGRRGQYGRQQNHIHCEADGGYSSPASFARAKNGVPSLGGPGAPGRVHASGCYVKGWESLCSVYAPGRNRPSRERAAVFFAGPSSRRRHTPFPSPWPRRPPKPAHPPEFLSTTPQRLRSLRSSSGSARRTFVGARLGTTIFLCVSNFHSL